MKVLSQIQLPANPTAPLEAATRQYVDYPPPVSLTDAATIATDCSLGRKFRVLLTSGVGATRVLGAPTNMNDGQTFLYEFIQSATGSNALTFNSIFTATTNVAIPTLSTTANAHNFLACYYNASAAKVYLLAFT